MTEAYAMRRLEPASLEAALAKADHYRDLNQPEESESICRDVLDVDPGSQRAWKTLGLALTDRFATRDVGLFEQSVKAFEHLTEGYERTYHLGIAWERSAKAHLERGELHSAATCLERALDLYDEAHAMKPHVPDAILRWNRCVRLIDAHRDLRSAMQAPRVEHPLGD